MKDRLLNLALAATAILLVFQSARAVARRAGPSAAVAPGPASANARPDGDRYGDAHKSPARLGIKLDRERFSAAKGEASRAGGSSTPPARNKTSLGGMEQPVFIGPSGWDAFGERIVLEAKIENVSAADIALYSWSSFAADELPLVCELQVWDRQGAKLHVDRPDYLMSDLAEAVPSLLRLRPAESFSFKLEVSGWRVGGQWLMTRRGRYKLALVFKGAPAEKLAASTGDGWKRFRSDARVALREDLVSNPVVFEIE